MTAETSAIHDQHPPGWLYRSRSPLTGKRVLVADDDTMVRYIVANELEDAGCIISEALDGAEALELLPDQAFDLLVTDVRMPRMDGWKLAERARAVSSSLPVLYVTGWSDVEPRPVPGGKVIDKPFRAGQLVAAAAALLDREQA